MTQYQQRVVFSFLLSKVKKPEDIELLGGDKNTSHLKLISVAGLLCLLIYQLGGRKKLLKSSKSYGVTVVKEFFLQFTLLYSTPCGLVIIQSNNNDIKKL